MDATHFDTISKALAARRLTRRTALVGGTAALAAGVLGTPSRVRAAQSSATPAPGPGSDPPADIVAIAQDFLTRYHPEGRHPAGDGRR